MHCKAFTQGFSDEPDKLESEMNEWLEANSHVAIKHITQSSCSGINVVGQSFVNVTVVIFYQG